MRKIRDVLRLHLKGGLSQRQIAAALGISKGVVAKYISLATQLGLAWDDIEWVRLRRLAMRPQLQIGLAPEAFVAADLRLSLLQLDDSLRPVRGMPAAVLVRDNGLDITASAMLDAVRAFRPNLVKS